MTRLGSLKGLLPHLQGKVPREEGRAKKKEEKGETPEFRCCHLPRSHISQQRGMSNRYMRAGQKEERGRRSGGTIEGVTQGATGLGFSNFSAVTIRIDPDKKGGSRGGGGGGVGSHSHSGAF